MTVTLDGKPITCSAESLWERRMLSGKPKSIRSYYPVIGRGNVDHDLVPHEEVERGLSRCAKKTLWEKFCGWLDI